MLDIKPFGLFLGESDQSHGHDLKALPFKMGDDLPDMPIFDGVWLDDA